MTKDEAMERAIMVTWEGPVGVAEALLTAHEEGRKKGLVEAMDRICPHKLGKQRIGTRHSFCCEHREAIRQLGGEK